MPKPAFFENQEEKQQTLSWSSWISKYSIPTFRVFNGLVGTAVAYQLLTDPDASLSEYGGDILVHALNAWVSETSHIGTVGLAIFLNLHRMATISEHLFACAFKCDSTIPFALNVVDLSVNHVIGLTQMMMVLTGTDKDIEKDNEESQQEVPKLAL